MRPPATAAATNSIATNNSPLPRNTVAKNRSSRAPIRSRSTPMNHKKAIPANGTRFSATATAARRPGSVSHVPVTPGWAGTESLSSTNAALASTEKTIPATAAARGARDGAAGEGGRVSAGVVAGDRLAAVAADAQALARDREHPGLGLDPALADLLIPVVEGQDPGRHTRRVLAVLVEGGRQDQVL